MKFWGRAAGIGRQIISILSLGALSQIMTTLWITVVTGFALGIALGVAPVTVNAAPLQQIFRSGDRFLKVEVLRDGVFHLEAGMGTPNVSAIYTSPQVLKTKYPGAGDLLTLPNKIQTGTTSLTFDEPNFCVTFVDVRKNTTLTKLCPQFGNGVMKLVFSKSEMTSVYGLGEKFRKAGEPNGDWAGDIRYPGVDDGNMMTGFDGNYTADMEIPIMYALGNPSGVENLNYGLFLDEVRSQIWNFKQDPWTVDTKGNSLRFYFLTGVNFPELRESFMELVGRPPIPGKKAFGLWVSQYGYKSWDEIDQRIKILRDKNFPADGFVLDLDWFGGISPDSPETHMGGLNWDQTHFPAPAKHVADYLERDGAGLILIEEPYVGASLPEFSFLKNLNTLALNRATMMPAIYSSWFGKGGMIDWTHSYGAAKWHDLKRQPLIDIGVFGHWTDLGEPSELNTGMKYSGVAGIDGDDASHMHNLFNFKWHESIALGYLRNKVARRPFMLSRTGTTGIQRFGGALWSGDISGRMTSLAAHLNAQMHVGLSGIDYFGSDIGGFYRIEHDGDLGESYSRWFAHGAAFDVPVRPHTAKFDDTFKTSPAEMGWVESNLANLRQRYELIPYYYSLAYRAYTFGEPVFPPPVYYYQNDLNVRGLGAEKMIGKYMLVATEATHKFTTSVYLPQGEWIDYHTFQRYLAPAGGMRLENFPLMQTVHIGERAIFRLPTFVSSGAILPKALVDDETMNAVGKRRDGSVRSELRAQIFPSTVASAFSVYEDDGETINYKSGLYSLTEISQVTSGRSITVQIGKVAGNYRQLSSRNSVIDIILKPFDRIKSVKLNGKKLPHVRGDQVEFPDRGWDVSVNQSLNVSTGSLPLDAVKTLIVTLK